MSCKFCTRDDGKRLATACTLSRHFAEVVFKANKWAFIERCGLKDSGTKEVFWC